MVNHTLDEIRVLARVYVDATGIKETRLSKVITGNPNNDKLIGGILAGAQCWAVHAEAASRWFRENWPADVPWPLEARCPQRSAAE
jgi:hypothetical protein